MPTLASEDEIRAALEKAFDYRGDVTVTCKDGARLEGYIFDRFSGGTLATSFVRLLPKDIRAALEDFVCRYCGTGIFRT